MTQKLSLDEFVNRRSKGTLARRLKNECFSVINKYDSIIFEIDESENLTVVFYKKQNVYSFKLTKNYPFYPPKITINNRYNLFEFSKQPSIRFSKVLKYLTGITCMCCASSLCVDNWQPSFRLNKIIDEIETFKNYKYSIIIKLMADKIKEKYLNINIDLDSWLFDVKNESKLFPGHLDNY